MIPAGSAPQQLFVTLTTPFGAGVLLLDSFGGREAISELFEFELRMRSSTGGLDPTTIVGQSVTLTLQDSTGVARYLNGIVTRFLNAGSDATYSFYTATLAPQLWLLTLTRDRTIYQNMGADAIIEDVLGAYGITYQSQLTNTYLAREYCVQYDESAFQFISRLMEDEGIFYFFTFANNVHTLVLADSPSAHPACASATIYCAPDSSTTAQSDRIAAFERGLGISASLHMMGDYDSTTAEISLSSIDGASSGSSATSSTSSTTSTTSSSSSSASSTSSTSGESPGVRYTFPGKYASSTDAQRKVGVRLAAQQLQAQIGKGTSFCYNLTAGSTFTLSGHPDSAFNVEYVARSVTHRVSQDTYENTFEVFPFSVPFRAPLTTPLPVVAGTHTANVVGSSGEEIWTDAYGRIKIKFHWDRSPGRDQNSSCWVRVSQAWAGSGWGHWVLPRIGQEVVVSYIDGDPDRPLVTGSVYNLQSSLPIALPGSQTQSVMRSRSSKGGTAGNEIRMEDLLNSEQLYLFAQKDMNVSITNALTTTVVGADETHTVQKGNRTVQVQTGNETHTVQGTRSLTVTGNETHTNSAAYTQSVSGNHTHTVSGNHSHTVSGDYTLNVTGNCTLNVTGNFVIAATGSVSIKSDQGVTSQAGTSHTVAAGTSLSLQGMSISEQASMSHSIEAGASLQLTGGVVEINS